MPAPGLSPKGSSEVRHTTVWIGTSGWSYRHWEKTFYPDGQRAREHLPFYARQFCTVELNYSYYRLPDRKTFENWRTAVPNRVSVRRQSKPLSDAHEEAEGSG